MKRRPCDLKNFAETVLMRRVWSDDAVSPLSGAGRTGRRGSAAGYPPIVDAAERDRAARRDYQGWCG